LGENQGQDQGRKRERDRQIMSVTVIVAIIIKKFIFSKEICLCVGEINCESLIKKSTHYFWGLKILGLKDFMNY
jgi:hypothetical protein